MALATLTDCKTLLNLSTSAKDALLTLLLDAVSSEIESYCGRTFGVADYDEFLKASFLTTLQLANYPINTVASVKYNGQALSENADYYLYDQYTKIGQLYRPTLWGGIILTRGLTFDPMDSAIVYEVAYNAGYNLPSDDPDDDPVEGVPTLPSEIQFVAQSMVARAFGLSQAGNIGENIAAISEGGLSVSYEVRSSAIPEMFSLISGMPARFAGILNKYRAWSVA